MLQKKKIIILRPRSLPQPFQNPPSNRLVNTCDGIWRNTKLLFRLMMFRDEFRSDTATRSRTRAVAGLVPTTTLLKFSRHRVAFSS